MSSLHVEYFVQSIKILQKYSLAQLLEAIPIAQINEMIHLHRLQLLSCNTYEKGIAMANQMLAKMTGYNVKINSFISNENDLRLLYNLMVVWRDSVIDS